MRGERDKDLETLMGRYGIGRRLAVRVVALLSKNVAVSGTLLAAAADDEGAERLLLSPQLLKDPRALDEAALQRQAAELGFAEAELVRLVEGEPAGWRVIALEDDLLAEQAGGAGGPQAEALSLVRAGPREISAQETHELFGPEEVARLKLTVLTSQNADERVEAIRKLVFVPMDGAQKAGIFLTVLTDREAEPRVRREAVRSLELIGFRQDMADAVRGLFAEEPEAAVYAVQRLSALLREAQEGEAALVLAVVLEVLDQSQNSAIVRELLRLVARSAPMLVTNYQKCEQFFRAAVQHLARDFDELHLDVEAAISACAEQAPQMAADLMWTELQRAESPRVRGLLLNLYESVAATPDQVGELARRALDEILNPALPESEKARLRYALVRLGEPAALVALDRIAQSTGAQRAELIRVLDTVCTESAVADETLQNTISALLDLLKLADTMTRRTILQTAILGDQRAAEPLQRELAGELLALMEELNLPDSLDLIQNTLEKIGTAALGPTFEFMDRSYPAETAERAALTLGRIFEDRPQEAAETAEDDALAGRVLERCLGLLADEAVDSGAFALALAGACGYSRPGAGAFDEALRRLREALWQRSYSMDILDALAVMAGSPNARAEHQQQLFELFDAICRYQTRAGMGKVRETEEGTVYEFGREMQFDIRIVPSAVRGLERICISEQAAAQLRTDIVKRLLVLWEGVANVRVIWGPAAIEALVRAMCSAACAPQATPLMRARLGESLLRFLNKISVVRSIGQIFSRPDAEPQTLRLALRAGHEVLDAYQAADVQDDERRLALLHTAGAIAANPVLEPDDALVQKLRDRTLQALYRGLREGMLSVREPLLQMRESPGLSEAQKQEIDERLGKAFGLVRIGVQR
jgi:hypothetical protein